MTLHVSGGNYVDGTLNSAAIMYPNAGSGDVTPGTGIKGLNLEIQEFNLLLTAVTTSLGETPLEETLGFPAEADNTPPSSPFPDASNPDGTPGTTGNGAVAGNLEDGAGLYSRLGPWGGLESLEPESLLAGASAAQPTGYPASGMAFTLVGGAPLGTSTDTLLQIEAAN
jgi:hypothetical protein